MTFPKWYLEEETPDATAEGCCPHDGTALTFDTSMWYCAECLRVYAMDGKRVPTAWKSEGVAEPKDSVRS